MARLGVFSAPLPDSPDRLEAFPAWDAAGADRSILARAYLDVNCAVCHRPGGSTGTLLDLRYHTPLAKANLIGRPPTRGRLGPAGSVALRPGSPEKSEMYLRMKARGRLQMPNLATAVADERALGVIAKWIELLENR